MSMCRLLTAPSMLKSQRAGPTCLDLLVCSHPVPPSDDRMPEDILLIKLFGLVHLPKQLHSVFFSQDDEFLPLPAPKNRLVKAPSLMSFSHVTFNSYRQKRSKCGQVSAVLRLCYGPELKRALIEKSQAAQIGCLLLSVGVINLSWCSRVARVLFQHLWSNQADVPAATAAAAGDPNQALTASKSYRQQLASSFIPASQSAYVSNSQGMVGCYGDCCF